MDNGVEEEQLMQLIEDLIAPSDSSVAIAERDGYTPKTTVRDGAGYNPLCQPFYNRGFSDARFPDQAGIIFKCRKSRGAGASFSAGNG